MVKAKIWIIDDSDKKADKVYDNFVMVPSEHWIEGTLFGEIENYKFTFTFTKFKPNGVTQKTDMF